jgi:hypothetical protein
MHLYWSIILDIAIEHAYDFIFNMVKYNFFLNETEYSETAV